MVARRFTVFLFSAAVGYGIALHELPKAHSALATTAVAVHTAR